MPLPKQGSGAKCITPLLFRTAANVVSWRQIGFSSSTATRTTFTLLLSGGAGLDLTLHWISTPHMTRLVPFNARSVAAELAAPQLLSLIFTLRSIWAKSGKSPFCSTTLTVKSSLQSLHRRPPRSLWTRVYLLPR